LWIRAPIIPVKYTATELPTVSEKIKSVLTDHNCQITYEENIGKRKLAYPIKHTLHGNYFVTEFNLNLKKLSKLNNTLRLMPEVLRHLIIEKKEKTVQEKEAEKLRRAKVDAEEVAELKERIETQAAPTGEKIEKPKEAKEKVSLEDLDKKLSELIDDSIL